MGVDLTIGVFDLHIEKTEGHPLFEKANIEQEGGAVSKVVFSDGLTRKRVAFSGGRYENQFSLPVDGRDWLYRHEILADDASYYGIDNVKQYAVTVVASTIKAMNGPLVVVLFDKLQVVDRQGDWIKGSVYHFPVFVNGKNGGGYESTAYEAIRNGRPIKVGGARLFFSY